jgi:Protein of unknown function (DUF4197)
MILGLCAALAIASGCNKKEDTARAQSPSSDAVPAIQQAEVQQKAALEKQTAEAAKAVETEKQAAEGKAAELPKLAEAEKAAAAAQLTEAPNATTPSVVPVQALLSNEEVVSGLKAALAKGVENAVASLGQEGGFLRDLNVKIPMPDSLKKVEQTLQTLRQDKLADDFVSTMNRAAEKAVPEAAAVLGDSIKQMTVTDARAILTGTNNAATQYFRRTTETNLYERLLPIVKKATSETGVTSAYKQMMEKTGFAGSFLGNESADIDAYVTHKALDGLFVKIADEEKLIRESPVARTTDLLQKVFGAFPKQ